MQERFRVSVRRSCRLALLRPSVWYAKSQARDQSALRQRIREIAMNRPRCGYLRVHVMLRREGWAINKKRVWQSRPIQTAGREQEFDIDVSKAKELAIQTSTRQFADGLHAVWIETMLKLKVEEEKKDKEKEKDKKP